MLPKDSPVAQEAVLDAVASAIRLPSIFNFDSVFKLGNLPLIKDHPLRVLLDIFLGKGLSDYQSWASSHADCMVTYSTSTLFPVNETVFQCQAGLDRAELERKIRLLTLASLASTHVGKAILYAQIASALQVPEQDVEKWVIQGAWKWDIITWNISDVYRYSSETTSWQTESALEDLGCHTLDDTNIRKA